MEYTPTNLKTNRPEAPLECDFKLCVCSFVCPIMREFLVTFMHIITQNTLNHALNECTYIHSSFNPCSLNASIIHRMNSTERVICCHGIVPLEVTSVHAAQQLRRLSGRDTQTPRVLQRRTGRYKDTLDKHGESSKTMTIAD